MDNLKETAKLYFMVKGHIPEWLHRSEGDELRAIYNLYLSRLWGNAEAYYRTEGFEEAWNEFKRRSPD